MLPKSGASLKPQRANPAPASAPCIDISPTERPCGSGLPTRSGIAVRSRATAARDLTGGKRLTRRGDHQLPSMRSVYRLHRILKNILSDRYSQSLTIVSG
jgi:hypothetical protein